MVVERNGRPGGANVGALVVGGTPSPLEWKDHDPTKRPVITIEMDASLMS